MYIQRVPHPLTRVRSRDTPHLDILQSTHTKRYSSSTPQATGYVVLAIVLALVLLSLVGVLIVRRLNPWSLRRRAKKKRNAAPPRLRKERPRFDGILPTLSDSSSPMPSSPCSEGPLTPSADYDHEHELNGDLGVRSKVDFDSCTSMPIPIHVHTSTMHEPILLHARDFPDNSAIRPHGLPLWPVPEESSNIPTLPSVYDDDELFYRAPPA